MASSTATGRVKESGEEVKAKAGGRGRSAPRPALTPMIDVTFQLLLFFLLTCEFRESEGMIPGTLPHTGPGLVCGFDLPPDPITIRVIPSADRLSASYELSGVREAVASPRRLGQLLKVRQELLGTSEAPVVIVPAGRAPWRFVVEAFNQAKKADYRKIGFGESIL